MRILNVKLFHVFFRRLFSLLVVIALISCVSTAQNLSSVGKVTQTTLSEGKALVFGKIIWIEDGKQKKIGDGMFDFYIKPSLLRLEDKTRKLCDVGEDGDFVWALEPGTYVINKLEYRDTWSGNYFFIPKIGFRIQGSQEHYYIGILDAKFDTKRDLIGGLSGQAKFAIVDGGEQALQNFSQKHGASAESIEKALMVKDERLPATFDTTAEYSMGLQLLNAILSAM